MGWWINFGISGGQELEMKPQFRRLSMHDANQGERFEMISILGAMRRAVD
jgi:hypothetical protein